MLAVKFEAGHPAVRRVPLPEPGQGEVLVKVVRSAICSTDMQLMKGYVPDFSCIPGHMFVGRVEPSGSSPDCSLVGQLVVGEINIVCDACASCRQGGVIRRNHCENRTVIGIRDKDGAMAEYMAVPARNLFALPQGISLRDAVLVEPLAAAFRITEQITLKSSDKIAVIGDGKLGLLVTEVLKLQPHKSITLFGRHQRNMDLLTDIETVLSDGQQDILKTHGNCFDVVVESSGSPSGIQQAAAMCRPLGTVVLKTTCAAGTSGFNCAPFVIKEVRVLGSRCGSTQVALEALAEGCISVSRFIAAEYALQDTAAAFSHAAQPGTLHVQLVMD